MPGNILIARCECAFERQLSPGATVEELQVMAYTADGRDLTTIESEQARRDALILSELKRSEEYQEERSEEYPEMAFAGPTRRIVSGCKPHDNARIDRSLTWPTLWSASASTPRFAAGNRASEARASGSR